MKPEVAESEMFGVVEAVAFLAFMCKYNYRFWLNCM